MVGGFILRRMLAVLPLLWFIWTLVFIVGHLVPGRGDDLYSSPLISRQSQEHMRQVYGLDQPLPEQYARQLLATLRGDLAVSTASGPGMMGQVKGLKSTAAMTPPQRVRLA